MRDKLKLVIADTVLDAVRLEIVDVNRHKRWEDVHRVDVLPVDHKELQLRVLVADRPPRYFTVKITENV